MLSFLTDKVVRILQKRQIKAIFDISLSNTDARGSVFVFVSVF